MKYNIFSIAKYCFFFFSLFCADIIEAQVNDRHVWVNGYYRNDGTYVRSHYRTLANETVNDNFSALGNVNPYTGELGWVPREPSYVYDSALEREIPESYIYKSVHFLQLSIVNNLNIYTRYLNKNFGQSIATELFWTLENTKLTCSINEDIWVFYEREILLDALALYFEGISVLFKKNHYLTFMEGSGITEVIISTQNSVLSYKTSEIRHKILLKHIRE